MRHTLPETMKAVAIGRVTPASEVTLTDVPTPQPKPGWVLVRVRAFGLNHSEKILRLSEVGADYIKKPIVPGIECVGEVVDAGGCGIPEGAKVAALMGGMGRSFDGSYAEYALVPAHHVFRIETDLDWAAAAAIPETYFTAWGSLVECLRVAEGDTLLVRGATCALGYAAVQLGLAMGARVLATTHRAEKLGLIGFADEALLDDGALAGRVKADKVLELVGPKTVPDSLKCLRPGGIVCQTGILGGVYVLNGFDPIKEIPNGCYLTGFFSNSPTQADIDAIFSFMSAHGLSPEIGARFAFDRIADACAALDAGKVNGKIVVEM